MVLVLGCTQCLHSCAGSKRYNSLTAAGLGWAEMLQVLCRGASRYVMVSQVVQRQPRCSHHQFANIGSQASAVAQLAPQLHVWLCFGA